MKRAAFEGLKIGKEGAKCLQTARNDDMQVELLAESALSRYRASLAAPRNNKGFNTEIPLYFIPISC